MKTRKPILALVILLVLVFMQGQAGAYFVTGNKLVNDMNEYEKLAAGGPNLRPDLAQYYMGYVSGVSDTALGIAWQSPSNVTVGQICSVVSKYLKNHPERWNEIAAYLVIDALREAFPLKK